MFFLGPIGVLQFPWMIRKSIHENLDFIRASRKLFELECSLGPTFDNIYI
jgi:hypothetical protein